MAMYCHTCGKDFTLNGCDCEHWDFATPVSSIRVHASGETDDPWVMREYGTYTATVEFGDESVEFDLCFRESSDDSPGTPKPARTFLKNLRRGTWEAVESTDGSLEYTIPDPFYTAKLVRVSRRNHFVLIANAVNLDPENDWRDTYTGGRARLAFGIEDGEAFLNEYQDHLTPAGRATRSGPWETEDDDRTPLDWVYSDHSASDDPTDSTRSKLLSAAARSDVSV